MKRYPDFRDLEPLSGVTWLDLVGLEPELEKLLWKARQACVSCRCWMDVERVFASVRNTLSDLIGFAGKYHQHPVLGSTGAYQVAYWKLYDAVAGLFSADAFCRDETTEEQQKEIVADPQPVRSSSAIAA